MNFNVGDKAYLLGRGPEMTIFAREGEQIALTWQGEGEVRREMRLPPLLLRPKASCLTGASRELAMAP